MATGKRYYWIKLRESFMTSDTVDYLMSQHDGANYIVLYQMLCLKTINTGGKLSRKIGEVIIPYDIEKIQRDCKWFSTDTIRVALNLYKSFGLIYEDRDGTLILSDHNKMVGSETDWAEKRRRQRLEKEERPALPSSESGDIVPTSVPQFVPIENRDKEIRDKEIRDKEDRVNEFHSLTLADEKSKALEKMGGKLGQGVVMLSEEQMEDLLEKLSLDEFDKYVAIVAECELNGKRFKKKSHYQAILDMVEKDRKLAQ